MAESPFEAAFAALDDADTALVKLEKLCCEPGRSPRMAELAHTLVTARSELTGFDGQAPAVLVGILEDAGGQLGRLQVGCCAENRLPLYAQMLGNLTAVQWEANRVAGLGH